MLRKFYMALFLMPFTAVAEEWISEDTYRSGETDTGLTYNVIAGAGLTLDNVIARGVIMDENSHQESLTVLNDSEVDYLLVHGGNAVKIRDSEVKWLRYQGSDLELNNVKIREMLLLSGGTGHFNRLAINGTVAINGGDRIFSGSLITESSDPYGYGQGGIQLNAAKASMMSSYIDLREPVKLGATDHYGYGNSTFVLSGSRLVSEAPAALLLSHCYQYVPCAGTNLQTVVLSGGSVATATWGRLVEVVNQATASITLDGSHGSGGIYADDTSIADVSLRNGSSLSGSFTNVRSLALDATSQVQMRADSDVRELGLDGGTIRFDAASPEFHTLTLENLSGGGHFWMNTDAASFQGDFIRVTGKANGYYTLHVANTGTEPVQTGRLLPLISIASGNASLGLAEGRVDIGAWQYGLIRDGNTWALVQAGRIPVVEPDPGPGGGGLPDPPVRPSTSPSTDAAIALSGAPRQIFFSELLSLRGRVASEGAKSDGVWMTVNEGRTNFQGGRGAAWRLERSGMLIGMEHPLRGGEALGGGFLSASSGQIANARGGESRLTARGGGMYAGIHSPQGRYAFALAKINRFNNSLSTAMSDGTGVSGRWHSWGYGLMIEGGDRLVMPYNASVMPFISLTGYRSPARRTVLSNGMNVNTGYGRTVRAEAGIRTEKTMSAGTLTVIPWITTTAEQDFMRSSSVVINDVWAFESDSRGAGIRAEGGISVTVTENTLLNVSAGYGAGHHRRSPFNAVLSVRIGF